MIVDARRHPPVARVLGALALACTTAAAVAQPAPDRDARLGACAAILDDRVRLQCYDRAAQPGAPREPAAPASAPVPPAPQAQPPAGAAGLPALDASSKLARDERRARGSTLGERWELDPGTKQGRFLLRPYKPMYVMPVRWSSDPNQQPVSTNADRPVEAPQGLNAVEASFQISLKAKVWETIADSNVDLWVAYTQVSHWQVYNAELSRPFRETNYEPEVFAIWGFDQPLFLGWRARFLGLGVNHQSNGRAEPLSRSWNRVIAQLGLENGDWSVQVRPWWRIGERPEDDDNPGIERYIGQGEMVITRKLGTQIASVRLRHSLRGGDESRGSVRLDWAFPVSSYLKAHLQLFTGYGESMIDFNHRQTTIGLGVSLVEWL